MNSVALKRKIKINNENVLHLGNYYNIFAFKIVLNLM